jgi:3-methyladenine DNA glycosylase Tag
MNIKTDFRCTDAQAVPSYTLKSGKRMQSLIYQLVSRTLEVQPSIVDLFDYYEGLNPAFITPRRLYEEVCWVVYSSGFKNSVISKYWPRLSRAFYRFDVSRVASYDSLQDRANAVCEESGFRNLLKASWCIENARRIEELDGEWKEYGGIKGYFERLSSRPLPELVAISPEIVDELALKGIGPTTVFHILKNMGLDVFKPDIHVRRLVAQMRLTSDEDAPLDKICEAMTTLSSATGYKVSQLDTFLFAYGIVVGDSIPVSGRS